MQPASVNGPGTGILTGASVISRSRRYSATVPSPSGAERGDASIAVALIVGRSAPSAAPVGIGSSPCRYS